MRSSTPTITWVGETGRLAWYSKYALARAAAGRGIPLKQIATDDAPDFGMPPDIDSSLRGCHGLIVVEWEGRRCTLIVDVAEGFFFVSPAMQHVDLYLCSAYHPSMFHDRQFPEPYSWQNTESVDTLRSRFESTLESCGAWFSKVQPYIPMPMSLDFPRHRRNFGSWLKSRLLARSMRRGSRTITLGDAEHRRFDLRYRLVESYRSLPIRYDIVVRDTFWASPAHRAQLHDVVEALTDDRRVERELNEVTDDYDRAWLRDQLSPESWRRAEPLLQSRATFEEPFEQMLASSRLNVHAVGKHWGWREICFLSMVCGTPILMDRPKFMPYCGLDDFEIWFTEGEWREIPDLLASITDSRWAEIRLKNQTAFDRHLAPDALGRHIIAAAMSHMGATDDELAELNI
ncbi:MAG: hypothetical protein O2923_00510 [Verrucomicrobia bacterium]|nr:hypothetical protein [Verrucomicrobiota bacterium]MDA1086035.1 hypothetical protein [Verrucomicrobiota bacterium]